MREPTDGECANHARIEMADGRAAYACWYPQMGGYVGKALVVADECVEVYVWHDGTFPFAGDDPYRYNAQPAHLHHCDGAQFVAFGEFLKQVQRR